MLKEGTPVLMSSLSPFTEQAAVGPTWKNAHSPQYCSKARLADSN